ncbi:FISUMP domain-containing protein [Ferruginibacter sp. SUN002]|uniref:FISUMP domain-containing protein n=1 Tax=Ferruginibacter sp. SUN002 TaxID=2937789 RepID=UPI003D3613FC
MCKKFLKEAGLNHWTTPNEGATNSSGFSVIGTGVRAYDATAFYDENSYCFYWRKTAFNATYANVYFLNWAEASVQEDIRNKTYGYSVRCLKD